MSSYKYNSQTGQLIQIAGSGSPESFHQTTPVTALLGATSVTIQDAKIHSTSLVFPFADNGTTEPMAPPSSITLTEGQCVLTFDALEADTTFVLVVLANSLSEGASLNDLLDVAISNPSGNQLMAYNGTTHKWVNISDIVYDNTISGLQATTVKTAIDELASAINTLNSSLTASY